MTDPVSIAYERHLERIIAKGAAADASRVKLCFRWVFVVSEVRDQWKADAFPALWHRHIELTRFVVVSDHAPTPADWIKRHFYRTFDNLRLALAPPKEAA